MPPPPQLLDTPVVGGSTPGGFGEYAESQNARTVIVWDDGSKIIGVQLILANGAMWPAGAQTGTLSRLDLQSAEIVTTLTMWPTPDGTGLGRIKISTNMGQIFDHGTSGNNTSSVICPVGSGIIVGFEGCLSNSILISLGFVFLNPLKSVLIDQVVYTTDPSSLTTGISPISLSHAIFSNKGKDPIDFTFQNSVTKTNSSTYEVAVAEQYGVSATVSAEFLGITVGASPSWSKTTTKTQSTTTSTDIAVQWSLTGTVAPGKPISCTASCAQGIINLDFTCNITLTFVDTTIPAVTISSTGVAKNVLYTNVTADVD